MGPGLDLVDLVEDETQHAEVHAEDKDEGDEEAGGEHRVGDHPAVLFGAVGLALVHGDVHDERDDDEDGGGEVADGRVPLHAFGLGVEHLHEKDVDLVAGEEGPQEGGQEEVVEQDPDGFAEGLVVGLVGSEDHEQLDDEEVSAEVDVDPDSVVHLVALVLEEVVETAEEAEDGEGAEDDGEDAEGGGTVLVVGNDV